MKLLSILAFLLLTTFSTLAHETDGFKPSETNAWGAEYPRVDSSGKVQVRVKAPNATTVKLNFWSGPKVDMAKQADGYWLVTTPPLVPGFHYYVIQIDAAEVADPNTHAYFGGGRPVSAVEVPESGSTYYSPQNVPHGQVREVWYLSLVTGSWRHALVYTPPKYEEQRTARFPVLICSTERVRTKPDGSGKVRRFWPGQDALGKRLKIGSQTEGMSFPGQAAPALSSSEVIGIAGDVRSMDLTKVDESYLYLPLSQTRQSTSVFLARTQGDPATLLPTIGEQMRLVDPGVPMIGAPLTMMLSMDPHFVASRVGGTLASVVGALGLLMACMGIYGMVSYSVAERTREIGIRMALGAGKRQLLGLVITQGFRPIFVGMVIGIAVSAGISRVLAAMLFGFDPGDGVLFLAVSLALGAIALVATYMPARRAMRVDPQVALRHE